MRSLLLPLLLTSALAGGAVAQQPFTDPDFEFTIKLPDGLHEISTAERARIMGITEDQARNLPRGEAAPGARIAHHYFWVDRSSPYNRQLDVHLFDAPPPYRKAEELIEAFTKTGLTVSGTPEAMKQPVGGLRIEGSFANQNGTPMRKTVLYLPDIVGGKYGLVSMQCFAGDWAIVKPEFLEALLSVRLQRAPPPAGAATAGKPPVDAGDDPRSGGKGGPKGGPNAASVGAAPSRPVDWKSLPVAGSLVLSALILGHLLLGGRGAR